MNTEIYYFSGTGNSLYIARELQARIPGARLIPMIALLNKESIRVGAETVGLVFPVHALSIPLAVKRFLEKLDWGPAEYVFAAATRLGTVFNGFEGLERTLRRKGKRLDSGFILTMGSNDVKGENFRAATEADIKKFETAAQEKLETMKTVILERKRSRERDKEYEIGVNPCLEKYIVGLMNLSGHIGGVNYFVSESGCSGCGICERVCLSKKIKMDGGRPVWRKEVLCYMCYACINFCPSRSIEINSIRYFGIRVKSFSRRNSRYSHPYAKARDIAAQKEYPEERW